MVAVGSLETRKVGIGSLRIEYVNGKVGKFSGEIQLKQAFIYCACVSSHVYCARFTHRLAILPFSSIFHT